mgnify:CR=1 FL=1
MDKSKHTEYEVQQLREYGYIKYPFKKQNNNKKNLQRLWKNKEITSTQYFFRSKNEHRKNNFKYPIIIKFSIN